MAEDPTRGRPDLDDLARGMANGTVSRRRALKVLGATVLGSLIPAQSVLAKKRVRKAAKTAICHATGSETNPYVLIEVSNNALPAHRRHQNGEDIIPAPTNDKGKAFCPRKVVTTTTTPPPKTTTTTTPRPTTTTTTTTTTTGKPR